MSESAKNIVPISIRELSEENHVNAFYSVIIDMDVACCSDLPELTQQFIRAARHEIFSMEDNDNLFLLRRFLGSLLVFIPSEYWGIDGEDISDAYSCGQRKCILSVFNEILEKTNYPISKYRHWR